MMTSAATQAATTSDRRVSRKWRLDSTPSPSPLPSGERAGVRGGALPQGLQTSRVLFELGQVILAIDGHHALQQLGRLRDFPFFLPDPREQVVGPGHAQFITQTPADPKAGQRARGRVIVPLAQHIGLADHPVGIRHAGLIAEPAHHRERALVVRERLLIVARLAGHQPEIRRQYREGRVVARPGQQVERLKIIGPCPLPFAGVGAQVAQIRQRGADASLIAEDLLRLEDFLVVLLRLFPPAADRADVTQVAQSGDQRAPVSGLPVAGQGLLIVVVGLRVETAPEVLVADLIEPVGGRGGHGLPARSTSQDSIARRTASLAPARIEVPSPTRIASKLYLSSRVRDALALFTSANFSAGSRLSCPACLPISASPTIR